MTILEKTQITHVFDRESEPTHAEQFATTLERMKHAQRLGKNIKYNLGYSNFTFEPWIILHKAECNGTKSHRRQYLAPLNTALGETLENLDQYKREDNFKCILAQLTLDDVCAAVCRAEQQGRQCNTVSPSLRFPMQIVDYFLASLCLS